MRFESTINALFGKEWSVSFYDEEGERLTGRRYDVAEMFLPKEIKSTGAAYLENNSEVIAEVDTGGEEIERQGPLAVKGEDKEGNRYFEISHTYGRSGYPDGTEIKEITWGQAEKYLE
jgi:hypothetical protein